ncbi:hypothetical protein BMF81_00218 [Nodularia spumigena UHCC 0039]|uniref:Uncharacterized protein n=1 Tax=Nodularia spumigena UHCC 0039 TaxID=1914872 RepID=A0A2S0Q532_NODSP|nr:hypothetical protein BMF81_00218 [Nodularia spumigena UHCC 0039]
MGSRARSYSLKSTFCVSPTKDVQINYPTYVFRYNESGLTQNYEKTNHVRVASPLLPKGEASAKGEGKRVAESYCVSPNLIQQLKRPSIPMCLV